MRRLWPVGAGVVVLAAGLILATQLLDPGTASAPTPAPTVTASPTVAGAASATPSPTAAVPVGPTPEPDASVVVITGGPIPGTYDAQARCPAAGESLAIVNEAATEQLSAVTAYLPDAGVLRSSGAYDGAVELGMDARTPNFRTYVGSGTARITATIREGQFTDVSFQITGELIDGGSVTITGSC